MVDREPVERRVLVGVDGSESSQRALRWAADYAALAAAELVVLTTWQYPTSYGYPIGIPDWDPAAQAAQILDDTVTTVLADAAPANLHRLVEEGHPAVVLVDASKKADLLVVGSRGHGEFIGMLLGSVSEHCVTHAHCPVVVVRGDRG